MKLQKHILIVQEPGNQPKILAEAEHAWSNSFFFLIPLNEVSLYDHWKDFFLLSDGFSPEYLDLLKRSIIKKLNLHPETEFSVRNFSLFVDESP